jgi:hypothetical protein
MNYRAEVENLLKMLTIHTCDDFGKPQIYTAQEVVT